MSQPLLGRCKDCDYALFATKEDVQDVDDFGDVRVAGIAYRVGNNGHFARCDKKHRFFVLKMIKGTYSEDHKCDARCLNARGHNCTCSCGGANHGRGHAVTTHVATKPAEGKTIMDLAIETAHRDLRKESFHIGEIGKHIRGTATITDKRENVGQYNNTLLVFATETGNVIKWFAPHALGNTYEIGQTITFRAKVKAHETHERFGDSTIVTYLEEINTTGDENESS